jgi:hypothetical protein
VVAVERRALAWEEQRGDAAEHLGGRVVGGSRGKSSGRRQS